MKTIDAARKILPVTRMMVEHGNVSSVSDAGVGALCIETAVRGASMNVKINAGTLENEEDRKKYFDLANQAESKTIQEVKEILSMVETRLLPKN